MGVSLTPQSSYRVQYGSELPSYRVQYGPEPTVKSLLSDDNRSWCEADPTTCSNPKARRLNRTLTRKVGQLEGHIGRCGESVYSIYTVVRPGYKFVMPYSFVNTQ